MTDVSNELCDYYTHIKGGKSNQRIKDFENCNELSLANVSIAAANPGLLCALNDWCRDTVVQLCTPLWKMPSQV